MSKICLGIDQSYKKCGWSFCYDDEIKEYGCIIPEYSKSNSERRLYISGELDRLIYKSLSYVNFKPEKTIIVFERIRLHSQGFLSIDYIKSTAGLITYIIDMAFKHGIKCYSVDTRSWKSQIVGTAKGKKKQVLITKGKNKGKYKTVLDNKSDTLNYVRNSLQIDLGDQDDDIADAICISKYPFLPKEKRKLKLEL